MVSGKCIKLALHEIFVCFTSGADQHVPYDTNPTPRTGVYFTIIAKALNASIACHVVDKHDVVPEIFCALVDLGSC